MVAHRIHRMQFGAEPLPNGNGTHFRLWAPAARKVALILEQDSGDPDSQDMQRDTGGWFSCVHRRAKAGSRYRFELDGDLSVPDPASRYQPLDVSGPSEVVDPLSFPWGDEDWHGRPWEEAVFYELHVGAFTPEGTFSGVEDRIDYLADLGVTAIELMPVAEAPGRRNWGYDGTYIFAPNCAYGRPEDMKRLVQAAHHRGLMVFLDVVYNHFGPEGNYLHLYTPGFFTERHHTPWGAAINFDGGLRPVRDFYIDNAFYWLEEFHLDGLRLDAVHAIIDDSDTHILDELTEKVMGCFQGRRQVHLVLENDRNESHYMERFQSGAPHHYVAQWNDDIHHCLHVLVSDETEGYYADFADRASGLLGRALAEGFAFQGEASAYRGGERRGESSAHLPPTAFVNFLQNHDQVGNRAMGERIAELGPEAAIRAATAILLLAPSPPLLFMGQEWGSKQPFPFFCDFAEDLAEKVREGRRGEFARFPEFRDAAARARIPDPNDPATFQSAVLKWKDIDSPAGRSHFEFHQALLELRHREIIPLLPGSHGHAGSFRMVREQGIFAEWRLGNNQRLWLLANPSGTVLADAPPPPSGRRIFVLGERMTSGMAEGFWPAWSVAWIIEESDAGASPGE